jgi:hypothetical protein
VALEEPNLWCLFCFVTLGTSAPSASERLMPAGTRGLRRHYGAGSQS